MLWENLTSITEATLVLFGQPDAELWRGLAAIAVLGVFLIGGPILYWIFRPDPASQLAKAISSTDEPENPAIADALQTYCVGEEVGGADPDEEVVEARDRKIVSWNGFDRVSGIDAHGHFFTGTVVHRQDIWRGWEVINGGWVLVRKDRSHHSVWCSYERQAMESIQIPA